MCCPRRAMLWTSSSSASTSRQGRASMSARPTAHSHRAKGAERPPPSLWVLHVHDGDTSPGPGGPPESAPRGRWIRDHRERVGGDRGIHRRPGARIHRGGVRADEGDVRPPMPPCAAGGLAQHRRAGVQRDHLPGRADPPLQVAKVQSGSATDVQHPVPCPQTECVDGGHAPGPVDRPLQRQQVVQDGERGLRLRTAQHGKPDGFHLRILGLRATSASGQRVPAACRLRRPNPSTGRTSSGGTSSRSWRSCSGSPTPQPWATVKGDGPRSGTWWSSSGREVCGNRWMTWSRAASSPREGRWVTVTSVPVLCVPGPARRAGVTVLGGGTEPGKVQDDDPATA
jgi:hypothetical protein